MGYSFDLPDEYFEPGKKADLINYLNNLPIPGKTKKLILLEYQERTGEEVTREEILEVYPGDTV